MATPQVRLRKVRLSCDLTQRDLAEKSGVANTTICLIEKGHHYPRPATRAALALALGVADEALLFTKPLLPVADALVAAAR